jgi:hypothetical protein
MRWRLVRWRPDKLRAPKTLEIMAGEQAEQPPRPSTSRSVSSLLPLYLIHFVPRLARGGVPSRRFGYQGFAVARYPKVRRAKVAGLKATAHKEPSCGRAVGKRKSEVMERWRVREEDRKEESSEEEH